MFDYIQQHLKLVVVIGIILVLGLFVVTLLLGQKPNTNTNTSTNTSGLIIDSSNQFLANENISDQDKYLMLLGQQMTEAYGTAQLGDFRPLQGLLNQSTDTFGVRVQSMINSLDKTKNVITVVDTTTFKLEKPADTSATVKMNAVTTDQNNNKKTNIASTVKLIKQGDYWLVEDIAVTNR